MYWLFLFNIEKAIYHIRKVIYISPFLRKTYFKYAFKKAHGYKLKLNSPETFLEKIHWLNLYGHAEKLDKYADKYEVRKYVKEKIGEQYLIPIYSIHNTIDTINTNDLPDKFIIKATHGSGWNIIIKDKERANWFIYKNLMNYWLKANFFEKEGELCYRNIKGRLIIEKYMDTFDDNLIDYKFWCFNGKVEFIGVYGERQYKLKGIILDTKWNEMSIYYPCIEKYKPLPQEPKNIKEMIIIAEKLSAQFTFVRVDLYSVLNQIYFGELTFMPGIGLNIQFPAELDKYYGSLIDIN